MMLRTKEFYLLGGKWDENRIAVPFRVRSTGNFVKSKTQVLRRMGGAYARNLS
jgi:hypothetical protein